MKKLNILKSMILLSIFISSCTKDEIDIQSNESAYDNGYFITNEGNFGTGNG